MSISRRIRQTQEREFFAHHMLLRAGNTNLNEATKSVVGRFDRCLATMVFSALAVEALANAVGSRIVSNWATFERLKPSEKIDTLLQSLNIMRDARKPPWPALRFLAGFRNDIAHPKPEQLAKVRVLPESVFDTTFPDAPLSKLEREITLGNARRVLEAVQVLKGLLTDAMPAKQRFGIYADASSGRARLAE
jgi:hypothetical protein